jgi:succinyl-CoA synthetase alpha subunit
MAILIDESSRVIIQGITGRVGTVFAERMAKYYSNFVGGVTPGKGGQTIAGKPVFNYVEEAVKELNANTSVIVVAAPFVKGAVIEALDAGIKTLWIYTDKVPVHETMIMVQYAKLKGATMVGPNSAGLVSPGKASAGELSEEQLPLFPGNIGLLSKSGSLSYEVINLINEAGFGFSTAICIGGDPILGTTCRDVLSAFKDDEETKAVVMIGEVGGTEEIDTIDVIKKMNKPIIAYISGHTAPAKKKMGHAGAIVSGNSDTAAAKTAVLKKAGVITADCIEEIPKALKNLVI